MQKSNISHQASPSRRQVMTSTTLNRKYVKRPSMRNDIGAPRVERHPLQVSATAKMHQRLESSRIHEQRKLTAKELKEQAIKRALANAARPADDVLAKQSMANNTSQGPKIKTKSSLPRIALAFSCAMAAVFLLAYYVNLNVPDISLKVAAMQTGINASYPGYIPNGYTTTNITSEDGKITLGFAHTSSDDTFAIIEESSSWDSGALLNNYVKKEYGDSHTVIREQGLTIYVGDKEASWVNGGVLYKINLDKNNLTKKQLANIATSL